MNESGNKHLSISISFGTLFRIAVFCLCIYMAIQLRSLILLILCAAVIASIIEPGIKWLNRRGIQRVFSALIMYLSIATALVVVFSFMMPPLFSEAINALNGLPKYIKTIDILRPFQGVALKNVQAFFPDLPATISVGDLAGMLTTTISDFSGGIFDTVSGFFGGLFSLIMVVVLSFYLSVRDDGIGEFLSIITPVKHEKYVRDLWRRSQAKIGKWVQGQLILAVAVCLMVYVALLATGIDHPFLLALLAAIFELIPVVGMTLSAIPAFLFAMIQGGIGLSLVIVAIYIFIQQIEAHIIYPLIVRRMVGVSPLLVIVSLLAGAELAGFVGVLLSIPVSVALVEFLDDIERRKRFKPDEATIEALKEEAAAEAVAEEVAQEVNEEVDEETDDSASSESSRA